MAQVSQMNAHVWPMTTEHLCHSSDKVRNADAVLTAWKGLVPSQKEQCPPALREALFCHLSLVDDSHRKNVPDEKQHLSNTLYI